jgi:hypothetical protein
MSEDRLGQVVAGRYRLDSVLGSGAVGVVYAATDDKDGGEVALKVLTEGGDVAGQGLRRFQREGAALRKLEHPHVVRVLDAGLDDAAGLAFIAMERLEGETLAERIDGDGPLSPALTLRLGRQILEALAYAHAHHVVHRDLKPGNIFLTGPHQRPEVKLLDFGLAKFLAVDADGDVSATLTQSGMVLGTPLYMAPEQCAGDRVDARADVYAAGCVLYEMLAGDPPFLLESQADVVRAHLVRPPPPLPEGSGDPALRHALGELIDRALAKAPEARFQDGAEMLAALGALASDEVQRAALLRARLRALYRPRVVLAVGVLMLALMLWPGAGPDEAGPWAAGVPDSLAQLHARIEAGDRVSREQIGELRRYAMDHRGDARPYLLMARAFMNMGWRKDAIVRYRRAFEVDPAARHDPGMLRDLIDLAESEAHHAAASEAIVEIHGAAARQAVEQARAGRPNDSEEHARLSALLEAIEAAGPPP